ncbi:hypothetical protein [Candidatus Mycoplasma haematobovis]|uniref:hypothetical protein n=1 Tax=Candidatus Mycoplasma haematobovis TaxID=432608 RepID=UPI000B09E9AA|nr:hypothetical protein [Candidatus Mycoplasma haematobovis]
MNSFIKQSQTLGEKINGVTGEYVSKLIEYCSVDHSVQDLIGNEYPNKKFVDFSKI